MPSHPAHPYASAAADTAADTAADIAPDSAEAATPSPLTPAAAAGTGARPTPRLRHGIRLRLVLVAVAVVLLALVAGGGLLLVLLQTSLRSSVSAAAMARAAEVSADVTTSGVSGAVAGLRPGSRDGQVVQLLDPSGRVLGSSSAVLAGQPMSPQRPADGVAVSQQRDLDDLGTPGEWLVVSRGVSADGRLYTVQVGVPFEFQRQAVRTVALFLLAAAPVLLLGVAVAVWLLVGRTLRPVEEIRRTVAGIRARRLGDRVPVPPVHDEIAALATTMNDMLGRLERADAAQRAFLSDAGHELRSPLAGLSATLDLAAGADDRTRRELVPVMVSEVDRMSALVADLMTLARGDDRTLVTQRVDVDLDDVVLAEVQRLRLTSRHRVVLQVSPARVVGDARRLSQVVRNLLDNADRHARTTIRVELAPGPEACVLRVDNDGPVVPAADRERIFDRFVRLEDARSREDGGHGLGLAISRQIVEAHGGRIAAGVGPAGECRFELTLPARDGDAR